VGQTINFEYDLADRDIKSFLADYSVNRLPSSSSINSNFSLDNKMYFTKKFLGTDNNEMHINFNEWFLKNSKPNEDHILKLDIEGDEYKVLPMITEENLLKMRIIIFEIHNFRNILFPLGLEIIQGIFDKLLKKHTIVHICPNNKSPSIKYSNKLELFDLLEITLLRNDRISYKECAKIFPHPLDSKNNPLFGNKLPDCFYL
jgi:hypothetical protein